MNGTIELDYKKNNEREKKFSNEDIYEEVSDELKVNINLVKECFNNHSEFSNRTIATGAFENITLPYLGKLKAKLRSVQKMTAKINRK